MVDKILGLFLIALGISSIIKPEIMIAYKKFMHKILFRAEYNASKTTHTVQRIVGVIITIVGLLVVI